MSNKDRSCQIQECMDDWGPIISTATSTPYPQVIPHNRADQVLSISFKFLAVDVVTILEHQGPTKSFA